MELLFALLIGFIAWIIIIYNLLVRDKNRVLAGWSDIDVQLKRRYELIPNIVETVKADHPLSTNCLAATNPL